MRFGRWPASFETPASSGLLRMRFEQVWCLELTRPPAGSTGTIVALTGEVDIVTDGARLVSLHNGDELMSKVTAIGCAGSAFVASALAVERDRWLATAAAIMVFGLAGELAALRSDGPGSLAFTILDSLHGMTPDMVIEDGWAEA